ncbi:ABC transporter permease [Laribacter hongkongensis]|uniref:ABC-type transport system, involved in lipoprotein release, permease component n=1 Tax=Laribacter hongkongensis TaxID=168471 RepID=A0A248LJV9_9NEIS|nr:ABC transporter permease [Laribacter hongkongensis]ASJ24942.1 ABC-type transport system, involved in lipoprotein release, permease component [Laribacter hongkongensis]MCG9039641.1 ABC transporter permease [Laribacter hongkongensis]MCG9066730.1 ABC transporter permease [Laribacter hongkongensis]MCG9088476.1 ABC transporter permease [Laribacter hongkongensis]MCG9108431.1 ABC transporter permease [Laribacter hongkongensis]
MKFVWTVAWRLMREGRFQSLLILAGVTIGVAVVVYITAVVNGLQANIIEKTLSTQAHIVLKPREDRNRRLIDLPARELMTEIETRTQRENTIDDWERRRQVATGIAGIRTSAAIASGPGFATKGGVRKSVSLIGVELEDYQRIVPLEAKLQAGKVQLPQGTVLIGNELARELGIRPGGRIRLVAATGVAESYTVSGILDFGIKDLSRRWVLMPLRAAQSLLGYRLDVTEIYLQTDDLFQADRLAALAAARTGLDADSWQASNSQLVTALRSQTASTWMIKIFVTLAVALGIASVQVVSVVQKRPEIGILRAMGTPASRIRAIFLVQGGLYGLVGSLLGTSLGAVLSLGFSQLARNSDGSALFPVVITPSLFIVTALIATVVGVLSAWLPARRAAALDPVEAIRG